jgi:hypothetical protein
MIKKKAWIIVLAVLVMLLVFAVPMASAAPGKSGRSNDGSTDFTEPLDKLDYKCPKHTVCISRDSALNFP